MAAISKTEIQWLERLTKTGKVFVITSNRMRDTFYIYEMKGGDANKLGKADNPIELEEKYVKE